MLVEIACLSDVKDIAVADEHVNARDVIGSNGEATESIAVELVKFVTFFRF